MIPGQPTPWYTSDGRYYANAYDAERQQLTLNAAADRRAARPCPYCSQPWSADEETRTLGGRTLHLACYRAWCEDQDAQPAADAPDRRIA